MERTAKFQRNVNEIMYTISGVCFIVTKHGIQIGLSSIKSK